MSTDNLGSKQTIILHNCLVRNEIYDLVITPHRQTTGYIRTKRQTRKKDNDSKIKTNYEKIFSKHIAHFQNQKQPHYKNFRM